MVDITPVIPEGKQVINSYGDGGFVVSSKKIKSSLIVLPDETIEWDVKDFADISESSFKELFNKNDIEVLLLGCGDKQQFLPHELEAIFKKNKIVVDCMDTGAACRTYNVLLSEERKVAAALIAI